MLRDSQGALGDFKAAIKLSPHTAHMYFNRGNLYASMEQFDQAEKDYSKGILPNKLVFFIHPIIIKYSKLRIGLQNQNLYSLYHI